MAGAVLVVGYAVLATCQMLVLNPLAAAPGRDLDQVHADLAAAQEQISAPSVVAALLVLSAHGVRAVRVPPRTNLPI